MAESGTENADERASESGAEGGRKEKWVHGRTAARSRRAGQREKDGGERRRKRRRSEPPPAPAPPLLRPMPLSLTFAYASLSPLLFTSACRSRPRRGGGHRPGLPESSRGRGVEAGAATRLVDIG
jgi:hypothetical protein